MRSKEALLRAIAEVAGIGGWELDPVTGELSWTEQTRAIHEVPDDFVPTLDNALDFFTPKALEVITEVVTGAIEKGVPYDVEVELVTAKGRKLWARAVGRPIVLNGVVTRVVGTFQDITAIRDERQTLATALAAAEAATLAKSQFLATMSHEIRTPMNGVIGMLDLLKAEGVTEKQAERLRVARQSADVLLVLLNDILDLSKLDADKVPIEAVPMSVSAVIGGVLDLFAPMIEEKGLRLQRPPESDLAMHVVGDAVRIRQILSNLVGNAIKFTARGEITVGACYDADRQALSVTVADTGIGITPDQLERLFEPFVQADLTTTRRFGGTGLGLSISRRLARLMDGEIHVTSVEGEGTTFEVVLPLRPADTSAERLSPASPPPIPENGEPLKILVAEDNAVNQMLITALLEADGHEITVAQNGAKAVAAVEKGAFDVILMDVQMPVMDGIEASKAIRAREDAKARLPIIAVTANAMLGDKEACLSAGMDDYLAKPIDAAALKGLLSQYRPATSAPATEDEAPREAVGA